MKRVPMTVGGVERLREELSKLKSVDRPKIIQAIAEARSHGDLSENAEYHAAREQQSFMEGRIAELEAVISSAQLIDPTQLEEEGRIVFGATVELLDQETDEEVTYQIVGEVEADLSRGQISIGSPIARALIGKEEGDVIEIRTPAGERSYEVLAVHYK